MGLFERFPYTNFHELNAEWLLKKMKELDAAMENFKATESLKFADPIIWDITTQYQKSTIVLDPTGNAYLSVKPVPAGVQLNNDEYWLEIFNFTDYTRTANKNLTAHVETNTTRATAAYNVDDWLIWEDVLYKVTAAIAIDDALVIGTNLVHFTVEDFIKAFITYATGLIQQYKNDIDSSELQYRNQLAQDIANTTANLQSQLDAAIAGVTVDSEVINARIGSDGMSYSTLGDALRGQIEFISKGLSYFNICTLTHGVISSSTGQDQYVGTPGYIATDFIRVNYGDIVEIKNMPSSTAALAIAAYSNYGDTTADIAKSVTGADAARNYTYIVPEGVRAIRINSKETSTHSVKIINNRAVYNDVVGLEGLSLSYIKDILPYRNGVISSSTGYDIYVDTPGYFFTDYIKVDEGDIITIKSLASSTAALAIAAYNSRTSGQAVIANSVSGQDASRDYLYTVPSGIEYIKINGKDASNPMLSIKKHSQMAKNELSILFVGNSMLLDAISYVPYLLQTYYPEVSFNFYVYYNGGKELHQQYQLMINNTPCETFCKWSTGDSSWTQLNASYDMYHILTDFKFDIVVMQEYFNYYNSYDSMVPWNECQNYITDHYTGGNALKFVSLLHPPKRDNIPAIYSLSMDAQKMFIENSVCDDFIPCGIAMYKAFSTSLNNLGDAGGLSVDGTHAQEGLPCLLQAYVVVLWLLDLIAVPKSIYNLPFKMTTALFNTLNIPGPDVGLGVIEGSDAENLLAQEMAVQGYKESRAIVLDCYSNI